MVKAVNLEQNMISFCADKPDKKKAGNETRILKNTPRTRIKQGFQKTSSAFLDYPIKGLKGDINSNFYEFLTMGIVPYLTGSAMFMLAFNCVNKHILPADKKVAASKGYKMALGVVFYGLLKSLSKHLVTTPVRMATGVDTEMPYENIVYPLPKEAGEDASIFPQHEQRKVYDSKEFFRKDLLRKEEGYFANIAAKLGLGTDLNSPETEATPIIQNIIATTTTAKSLSSYAWAATGVGLAFQDSWQAFFNSITGRKHYTAPLDATFGQKVLGKLKVAGENSLNITSTFFKSLGRACRDLWKGNPEHKGYMKHAGKGLVGATIALTTVLTANSIIRAKNMAKNKNVYTIDKTKESTVI